MSNYSLLLLGAGKMGGALLNGWLSTGLDPKNINVVDPNPSEWLMSHRKNGLNLNQPLLRNPDVCIIAVKPQIVEKHYLRIYWIIKPIHFLFQLWPV